MSLYSESHIEQQKNILAEVPAYGSTSIVFAPMVSELIASNEVSQLLDYGAGQGMLGQHLSLENPIDINYYDPAVDRLSATPEPSEMVTCLDVLDTIESDCIDAVLDDLQRLVQRIGFFSVNTNAEDGSSQASFQPVEWWLPKILSRFELHYFSRIKNGFVVVVKKA